MFGSKEQADQQSEEYQSAMDRVKASLQAQAKADDAKRDKARREYVAILRRDIKEKATAADAAALPDLMRALGVRPDDLDSDLEMLKREARLEELGGEKATVERLSQARLKALHDFSEFEKRQRLELEAAQKARSLAVALHGQAVGAMDELRTLRNQSPHLFMD